MEHHEPSGMYYNWYDEATGEALHTWPGLRRPGRTRSCSSVDNGWLGAALLVVQNSDRRGRAVGQADLRPDALGRLLRRQQRPGPPGAPRWPHPRRLLPLRGRPPRRHLPGHPHRRRPRLADDAPLRHDRVRDPHHELPRHHHRPGPGDSSTSRRGAPSRRPATGRGTRCSRSARHRTYFGIDVYEGAYTYRGMHIVPGWGGSMFEELMPDVFVDEAAWAPQLVGSQPPAARPGPARARPHRRRLRLLGLQPVEQPRRRLPRVRRRRARAQPRRATSPTRRARTTTSASATAVRRRTRTRPTATASSRRTRRSSR